MPIIQGDAKKLNNHSILLPDSLRRIFFGPSGCGKGKSILSLTNHLKGSRFENLYVHSKSLYQRKYQLSHDVLNQVKGVQYLPSKDNDEIIDVDEVRKKF